MLYVLVKGLMDVVFSVYIVTWSCMFLYMENMSVSSCICCMCVSCVHYVAVLNAAFCMTYNLLMLAMGSAVLFILRSRLLLYSAGSGVNRVQVVLSGLSVRFFVLYRQKLYVCMVVCIPWLHSCLCM